MKILVAVLFLVLSVVWFAQEAPAKPAPQDLSFATTTAAVLRVIDGDTIVVDIEGKNETVRYIGIDTPEPYRDGEPACFSLEASLRNKELVAGKTVELLSDVEDRDRYGRLLRYVYVDGVFVNQVLVEEGYAAPLRIKPNTQHADDFVTLAEVAAQNGRGMWAACELGTYAN